MECRAYGICLDSQSRGYLGKDRKVSSAAGGNLSRMHKTQETAKESRLNFMYSHLRNRTLAIVRFAMLGTARSNGRVAELRKSVRATCDTPRVRCGTTRAIILGATFFAKDGRAFAANLAACGKITFAASGTNGKNCSAASCSLSAVTAS